MTWSLLEIDATIRRVLITGDLEATSSVSFARIYFKPYKMQVMRDFIEQFRVQYRPASCDV